MKPEAAMGFFFETTLQANASPMLSGQLGPSAYLPIRRLDEGYTTGHTYSSVRFAIPTKLTCCQSMSMNASPVKSIDPRISSKFI